jgi:hypothetical protein
MSNRGIFADMRRSGFGIGVSKAKLVKAMLEILPQLPIGTQRLKDTVVANLGLAGQMTPTRDLTAAWDETKKKAAKQYPDKFILDDRNVLHWNDGSVEILDKKVSAANFKKLNELAQVDGCTVNHLVSKLIKAYQKGKA